MAPLETLGGPIANLVEVLKTVGAAGLSDVSKELQRLTEQKARRP